MSKASLLAARISLKNALYEIERTLKEEYGGEILEDN